jgi:hypothetical protein
MNKHAGDFSASGAEAYATFCSVITTAKATSALLLDIVRFVQSPKMAEEPLVGSG